MLRAKWVLKAPMPAKRSAADDNDDAFLPKKKCREIEVTPVTVPSSEEFSSHAIGKPEIQRDVADEREMTMSASREKEGLGGSDPANDGYQVSSKGAEGLQPLQKRSDMNNPSPTRACIRLSEIPSILRGSVRDAPPQRERRRSIAITPFTRAKDAHERRVRRKTLTPRVLDGFL